MPHRSKSDKDYYENDKCCLLASFQHTISARKYTNVKAINNVVKSDTTFMSLAAEKKNDGYNLSQILANSNDWL